MKRYKFAILICIITLVGMVAVITLNKNKDDSRIPKLIEGVNVHEMENEIFSVLGPESVSVSTDRSSGSGMVWKYDGRQMVVVTTNHMMQHFESGELELWTGEKVSFSKDNVYQSEEMDVAVIAISCEKKLKLNKCGVESYLAEELPKIGDTLWMIDSVYGAASGMSTCSVASELVFLEDYGTEMLLLYGEGKTGMSGSPIYDGGGRLVAMMSGMSEDRSTLAAVPVDEIKACLGNSILTR